MNRRTFLKSIATVCGAAIVCPGELAKSPTKHLWMQGKDGSYIEGEKLPLPWKNYYANHQYSGAQMKKLVEQLEKEFWNTTFKPPLMRGINETT